MYSDISSGIKISGGEVTMEKPRKHKYSDKGYCYGCEEFSPCSHNALLEAMSTWIEGAVLDEPKLWNVIYNVLQKDRSSIKTKQLLSPEEINAKLTHKLSKAIHALLTQRLGGK